MVRKTVPLFIGLLVVALAVVVLLEKRGPAGARLRSPHQPRGEPNTEGKPGGQKATGTAPDGIITLRGHVIDSTARGITGARVEARALKDGGCWNAGIRWYEGTVVGETTTGADGSFILRLSEATRTCCVAVAAYHPKFSLPDVRVQLIAATGHIGHSSRDIGFGREITLQLRAGGRLRVKPVLAEPLTEPSLVAYFLLNENGECEDAYSFRVGPSERDVTIYPIVPGRKTLLCMTVGGSLAPDPMIVFSVRDGEQAEVQLSFRPGSALSGVVREKNGDPIAGADVMVQVDLPAFGTLDPIFDPIVRPRVEGHVVNDELVILKHWQPESGRFVFRFTPTDGRGKFTIGGLWPAVVKLYVEKSGYHRHVVDVPVPEHVEIVLEPAASSIVIDLGDSRFQEDRITVCLYSPALKPRVTSVPVSKPRVLDVRPGHYLIILFQGSDDPLLGNRSSRIISSHEVGVPDAAEVQLKPQWGPAGRLDLELVDQDSGKPVSIVDVDILLEPGGLSPAPKIVMAFRTKFLPSGSYRILVTGRTFQSAESTCTIVSRQVTSTRLVLKRR